MKILYSLIRLLFFYFLFSFLLRAAVSFIRTLWNHKKVYKRDATLDNNYKRNKSDSFNDKNVVDAEFKEIK